MNDSVTVRSGVHSDLLPVAVLAGNSQTATHWRPEDYLQILRSGRLLLVAETPEAIVGFLVAHDVAGEWELENIAVAAERRRNGIARRLIAALVAAIEGNGTSIFLEVRESNLAAQKLYQSSGFEQYSRRKAYYSDPAEDALLYRFLCTPETLENC